MLCYGFHMAPPKSKNPKIEVAATRMPQDEYAELEETRDLVGESRSVFIRVAVAERAARIRKKMRSRA